MLSVLLFRLQLGRVSVSVEWDGSAGDRTDVDEDTHRRALPFLRLPPRPLFRSFLLMSMATD